MNNKTIFSRRNNIYRYKKYQWVARYKIVTELYSP